MTSDGMEGRGTGGELQLHDMLIRLYALPPRPTVSDRADGVTVRRVLGFEKQLVVDWVEREFGPGWAGECDVACSAQPATCFMAVKQRTLIGFSCFDATFRGFFGPMGILEAERGRRLGRDLLLTSLWAMWDAGYAYAVAGATRSVEFYRAAVGAEAIPRSFPGAYPPSLKSPLFRRRPTG